MCGTATGSHLVESLGCAGTSTRGEVTSTVPTVRLLGERSIATMRLCAHRPTVRAAFRSRLILHSLYECIVLEKRYVASFARVLHSSFSNRGPARSSTPTRTLVVPPPPLPRSPLLSCPLPPVLSSASFLPLHVMFVIRRCLVTSLSCDSSQHRRRRPAALLPRRYQHLDAYLAPPSPADTLASAAGTPMARAVARPASSVSKPGGKGPGKEPRVGAGAAAAQTGAPAAGGALLPAAAGRGSSRRLAVPQSEQGLPAIEFDEPEEEPRGVPRSRGQQRAKRSRPGDGEVSQAGVEAAGKGGRGGNGGGGGEKAMALDGENEDEDGDDFMALPTGGVGLSRSGSNGGSGSVFGSEVRCVQAIR